MLLARVAKTKREETSYYQERTMGQCPSKDIRRIRDYYQLSYTHKYENVDKMDQFLKQNTNSQTTPTLNMT